MCSYGTSVPQPVWYEEATQVCGHVGSAFSRASTSVINSARLEMRQNIVGQHEPLVQRKPETTHVPTFYGLCDHVPQCVHPLDGLNKYGWPRLRASNHSGASGT